MFICGKNTLITPTPLGNWLAEYRCKCWSCETCAPVRAWLLRQDAKHGAPERFITLTLPSAWANDPDTGARLLVHAWRMVIQKAARQLGLHHLEYLAVFETTKKGTPHLHILQRGGYIPRLWLSRQMAKFANAPIVDIRRVNNRHHAARYIAKYLAKDVAKFEGCKRYWKTQHWTLYQTEPKHGPDWVRGRTSRCDGSITWWRDHYRANGYQVTDIDERHAIAAPPPRPPPVDHTPREHP